MSLSAPTAPPEVDPLAEEFFEFLSVEKNVSPRTLANYEHALLEFRRRYARFGTWFACTADDFRRERQFLQSVFVQLSSPTGRTRRITPDRASLSY